jgi:hypothetical protein
MSLSKVGGWRLEEAGFGLRAWSLEPGAWSLREGHDGQKRDTGKRGEGLRGVHFFTKSEMKHPTA